MNISRIIIKATAKTCISYTMLLETKLISAQETNSLSAIGSSIFPNLEDWLNDLAK